MNTDYLFKKNLKINTDSLPEALKDSVSLAQSAVLGKVINKTFISLLYNGIFDEMKKRKFKVYNEDSIASFMQKDTTAWVFNLTQIELDEFNNPYTASQQFDTMTYYQDFDLNAASINLWFEVSQQNSDQDKGRVLFSSQFITDIVDGYFKRTFFSKDVNYIYQRKDITVDDVYNMAANFGAINASYIFDYFMNEYVYKKYKGQKKPKYMHYDPVNKTIVPAAYNRFIFM